MTSRVPRSALAAWMQLSWRAIPRRTAVGALALPVVFIGFAYLVLRNNETVPELLAARTVRICGTLALGALAAGLGNTLLRARPPWSWARSLPWSAAQRVHTDALLLGLPLCGVPFALAPANLLAAFAVAGLVPPTAACAAAALRVGARRQTGMASETIVFLVAAGVLVAIWPIASVAVLCLTPCFLRWAAHRERASTATRFVELQHDAAGDPSWLGAP